MELTLWAVVAVALFFDFTNGFHDTANSIATSVSTRALSPRLAVASAAVLNFAGAFVSIEVAATIAKGIVNPDALAHGSGLPLVFAALVAAPAVAARLADACSGQLADLGGRLRGRAHRLHHCDLAGRDAGFPVRLEPIDRVPLGLAVDVDLALAQERHERIEKVSRDD